MPVKISELRLQSRGTSENTGWKEKVAMKCAKEDDATGVFQAQESSGSRYVQVVQSPTNTADGDEWSLPLHLRSVEGRPLPQPAIHVFHVVVGQSKGYRHHVQLAEEYIRVNPKRLVVFCFTVLGMVL